MREFTITALKRIALAIGFLIYGSANLFAQTATEPTGLPDSQIGGSLLPSMGKVGFILIVVIVSIYLTLMLLKRLMGRKVTSGSAGTALELMETCYLSPKKSLSYVRLGNKSALLAVTETSITSVMELDSDETTETLEMIKAQGKGLGVSFTESLSKATRKIVDLRSKRVADGSEVSAPTAEYNRSVRQEAQL